MNIFRICCVDVIKGKKLKKTNMKVEKKNPQCFSIMNQRTFVTSEWCPCKKKILNVFL